MAEFRYLTVSALTKYIKRKFDYDPHLQNLYVKGEISNMKKHTSGHIYFTLKDAGARILAVMFSAYAQKAGFQPEDGMHVLVRGDVSVYEPSGNYQIYVKEIQPDGIGSLYLAYKQLEEKLAKEGLFRREHKKPIPRYPQTVGVVTSPTGAAVRDIITTIRRRYPIARIIVYPTLVQGKQAAPSIVRAIEMANARGEADVLIVGRGGGSIEELWAFNEEAVARAIFRSKIPVISAVGHETDVTIADHVADLRAPTPTGAAELAVPHIDELLEKIFQLKIRLTRSAKERTERARVRLSRLENSYAFRFPQKLYEQKMEQLDKTFDRLQKLLVKSLKEKGERREALCRRLWKFKPAAVLREKAEKVKVREKRLNRLAADIRKRKEREFLNLLNTLEAVSPLRTMERGYSIVYHEKGNLVKSVRDAKIGDQVYIYVKDGNLHCEVKEREESGNRG
ncbi:MAG: exodeoxyribonuclease VII large subunit [Bacillaceae bacterium]|nr:exodeoxyribonuclease VII large subunit [Bacillaceae bacterium]